MLHAYEYLASAAVCYEWALLLDRRAFHWAYLSARAHTRLGERDKALRTALARKPDLLPARVLLAELLRDAGELTPSGQHFEAALRQNPESAAAHYGYGRLLVLQGRNAEALQELKRAVELWETYGAAHYTLALAYRKNGDHELAERHMHLFRRYRGSEGPPAYDPLLDEMLALNQGARRYVREGVRLLAQGRSREAITAFRRALEVNPERHVAQVQLIIAHGELGELDMARTYYRQLVTRNLDVPEVHYVFGAFARKNGAHTEAIDALRVLIEIMCSTSKARHRALWWTI